MKLKLFSSDCCDQLLAFKSDINLKRNYDKPTFPSSLIQYLDKETGILLQDNLKLGGTASSDGEDSIALHTGLNMDKMFASDRRFWAMLTHTVFYFYAKNRWDITSDKSDDSIQERMHYEGRGLATVMRNALSRLWWAAELTIDKNNKEDPYKFTRILFSSQDVQVALTERSIGTIPNVMKGFLNFYEINRGLGENNLRLLASSLNAVGGYKMLSSLSELDVIRELKTIANHYEMFAKESVEES